MTSKSQRHKEEILSGISKMEGITEDRYGNFIRPDGARYHPKKTALNSQRKMSSGWKNVWSAYYKDISITDEGKLHVQKVIR